MENYEYYTENQFQNQLINSNLIETIPLYQNIQIPIEYDIPKLFNFYKYDNYINYCGLFPLNINNNINDNSNIINNDNNNINSNIINNENIINNVLTTNNILTNDNILNTINTNNILPYNDLFSINDILTTDNVNYTSNDNINYTINNDGVLNNSISDILKQTNNLNGEELLEYLENQSKEVVDILLQFNFNNILNKLRSIFLTTVFRLKGKTSHSNDVPRPLNAYMIYRKRNLHLILEKHIEIKTQNEVNIIIGKYGKMKRRLLKMNINLKLKFIN
ncbi:hypothetical protein LY90DRAFT_516577 [Neocallimastix californiae]|uniref:Uncharacterized protein n=1 Tax=Neocallimastix californiae TaxID=1754190 RepID=A0A1Y2ADY9_9FUNG|nr:hypothetical protein LY90DRAFT_516577 [Neocallimastix californiae]|eukprot:ORY20684.1 hypothetical protein LY90DRAFT_516577 [Neocallimastix californiae]